MREECLRLLELLSQTLSARNPENVLPPELANEPEVQRLHAELIELRRFIFAVAQGDLSSPLTVRGYTAGALKSLQASLKHMTWQTQMIASGDFSQRLDFMGDFSVAFNSMTNQLAQSVRTILEKDRELEQINAGLRQEITIREQAQRDLAASERHFRMLTESMKDVVWILDSETLRFLYVSPSVKALRGYLPEEIVGRHIDEMLAPDTAVAAGRRIHERRLRFLSETHSEETFYTAEVEELCKDGTTVWTEAIFRYRYNEKTAAVEVHGVSRDITERRSLRLRLEQQASRDDLTGTLNRRHFLATAEQVIRQARRDQQPFCLIMLDLDHFKRINDTHGHATGDRALREVAATCQKTLRDTDFIGRLGGEEFAVALSGKGIQQGANAAERIRANIAAMNFKTENGEPVAIRVSLGVAQLSEQAAHIKDILSQADKALYRAKLSGRNRVECSDSMAERAPAAGDTDCDTD